MEFSFKLTPECHPMFKLHEYRHPAREVHNTLTKNEGVFSHKIHDGLFEVELECDHFIDKDSRIILMSAINDYLQMGFRVGVRAKRQELRAILEHSVKHSYQPEIPEFKVLDFNERSGVVVALEESAKNVMAHFYLLAVSEGKQAVMNEVKTSLGISIGA